VTSNRLLQPITTLTLLALFLAGCAGTPPEPVPADAPAPPTATPVPPTATPIPPTMTPIPPTPIPQAATADPTPITTAPGILQPLNEADCAFLADTLSQTLGLPGETIQVPFEDFIGQQTGTGCQTTITGDGNYFDNIGTIDTNVRGALQTLGWEEDMMYAAGGAGGLLTGFRHDSMLCLLVISAEPSEDALCPQDEPIAVCWERLTPEQRRFTTTLNCAQAPIAADMPLPKTEPARIQFAPGAISAQVLGSLAPGGLTPYMLTAMAGQEMTVNLTSTSGGVPVAEGAILVIWGMDGTVLISDHADATNWVGVLPLTQDYLIDVVSVAQVPVDYALEIIIPPATNGTDEQALPRIVPAEFQAYLQTLLNTGVPPMLPPEFPLSTLYPYIYIAEPGEYELSLDIIADCQGAGACHYGSMAGKKVDSSVPVGTQTIPFEAERAQKVLLVNGIEGYFIESACGASCSDAQVFWIYDGYQYVLGLKAAKQSDVLDLANAAISNSIQ